MNNQQSNPKGFNFLTPGGEKVLVDPRWAFGSFEESINYSVVFNTLNFNETFRVNYNFSNSRAHLQDLEDPKTIKAFQDFAKDQLLVGNWRIEYHGNPPDWKKEKITTWEEMVGMGFSVKNEVLYYERKVEALALEADLTRWQILEKLYKQPTSILKAQEIVKAIGQLPLPIERELDVLKDLDLVTTVIKGIDRRDTNEYRLTAQGRKHYEERVLPAHNQVFIIAPCSPQYQIIVDAYHAIVEQEFGMKAKFQERSTTKEPTIRDDFLASIRASRFIIADITGKGKHTTPEGREEFERFNPNCVYELGYAHRCDKKLICCVREDLPLKDEKGNPVLPFDFAGVNFSFWNPTNLADFETKLESRIDQLQDHFTRERWSEE